MASKATGSQVITFCEDGYDYGPDGESYFEIWRGTRDQVIAKTTQLKAQGYRVQRRKWSGPGYQLTATISLAPGAGGGSGGAEVPVDRWRITTQLAQLDMRSNPKLIAAVGDEGLLNVLVKAADNLINSGDDGSSLSGLGLAIFNLRARGGTSYELKRPVLTRIRTVSTNYPRQFVMESQPIVYTTARLVSTFGVPQAVVKRLPPTPATAPTDTQWSWLWQQQDSDTVPTLGRVEEMDSWVFGAWSTILYEVLS